MCMNMCMHVYVCMYVCMYSVLYGHEPTFSPRLSSVLLFLIGCWWGYCYCVHVCIPLTLCNSDNKNNNNKVKTFFVCVFCEKRETNQNSTQNDLRIIYKLW